MSTRLMRSDSDKMIGGVCGGLGIYLGVDPVLVRLTFLLLAVSGGIGIVLYFALMILMPRESDLDDSQAKTIEKNIDDFGDTMRGSVQWARAHPNGPIIAAGFIILVGVYFLLNNLGISLFGGALFWPLVLICAGIFVLVRRKKK